MNEKKMTSDQETTILDLATLVEKAAPLADEVASSRFSNSARDQFRNLVGLELADSLMKNLRRLFSPLARDRD